MVVIGINTIEVVESLRAYLRIAVDTFCGNIVVNFWYFDRIDMIVSIFTISLGTRYKFPADGSNMCLCHIQYCNGIQGLNKMSGCSFTSNLCVNSISMSLMHKFGTCFLNFSTASLDVKHFLCPLFSFIFNSMYMLVLSSLVATDGTNNRYKEQ